MALRPDLVRSERNGRPPKSVRFRGKKYDLHSHTGKTSSQRGTAMRRKKNKLNDTVTDRSYILVELKDNGQRQGWGIYSRRTRPVA